MGYRLTNATARVLEALAVGLSWKADRDERRIQMLRDARPPIPDAVRLEVFRRAHWACLACGSPVDLQVDHVKPWSKGGAHDISNFQALCGPCNRLKGTKSTDYRGRAYVC